MTRRGRRQRPQPAARALFPARLSLCVWAFLAVDPRACTMPARHAFHGPGSIVEKRCTETLQPSHSAQQNSLRMRAPRVQAHPRRTPRSHPDEATCGQQREWIAMLLLSRCIVGTAATRDSAVAASRVCRRRARHSERGASEPGDNTAVTPRGNMPA